MPFCSRTILHQSFMLRCLFGWGWGGFSLWQWRAAQIGTNLISLACTLLFIGLINYSDPSGAIFNFLAFICFILALLTCCCPFITIPLTMDGQRGCYPPIIFLLINNLTFSILSNLPLIRFFFRNEVTLLENVCLQKGFFPDGTRDAEIGAARSTTVAPLSAARSTAVAPLSAARSTAVAPLNACKCGAEFSADLVQFSFINDYESISLCGDCVATRKVALVASNVNKGSWKVDGISILSLTDHEFPHSRWPGLTCPRNANGSPNMESMEFKVWAKKNKKSAEMCIHTVKQWWKVRDNAWKQQSRVNWV
jgi:hypothetical protein